MVDESLKRGLVGSSILHLALLAALAVRLVPYPSEPIQLERAIRVDIVGLPSRAKPSLEEPAPKPPAKPEPNPPEAKAAEPPAPAKPTLPKPAAKAESNKIDLTKARKSQTDAIKRLEALAKIEEMRAKHKQEAAKPAPQPIRGNQVSSGNSLSGMAKIDYDGYLESLDAHVKKHWALPEWLATASLRAQIVVWIDARGNVVKKELARPSGNSVFDQRAIEAVERSSPFPPPPARLANIFAVDGVRLGFPE